MPSMLFLLLLAAQVDRLPPANPLPPPGADEADVMAPVNALLRGVETADRAAIADNTLPEGGAAAAVEQPDGTRRFRRTSWPDFAAGLKPGSVLVRLSNPAVEVDGDVAMVWARYTAAQDSRVSYCGYYVFDVVRTDARWRILNATSSGHSTGCEAP